MSDKDEMIEEMALLLRNAEPELPTKNAPLRIVFLRERIRTVLREFDIAAAVVAVKKK